MPIKVTLRNGNEYLLLLDGPEADAERLYAELAAGRSQALRGWVSVESADGSVQTAVRGDEVVELHLVRDAAAS
jgi:hypothetical protein